MPTQIEATLDDLYRVAENGKAELVNGEIILMSPTGGVPGRAGGDIYSNLHEPAVYRSGDLAEAEPALPGWSLPVDDILP